MRRKRWSPGSELMSLRDAAPMLVRDDLVHKAFRRRFTDAAQRLERIGRGEQLNDDEHGTLADTLHNDARRYVRFWGVDGSFGKYPIEILGLGGVYYVWAPDHGWVGYFGTVEDAEAYINFSWTSPPHSRTFREPFAEGTHKATTHSPGSTPRRRSTGSKKTVRR